MPATKPLACVMGDMDLVRPLGLTGIPCAVVAKPGASVRYSRFTRAVIEWADAWTEPDLLVERLLRFGRAQAEKPVLYYQEDRELLLVSRYRSTLSEAFRFVIGEAELVEDLVHKGRFQALAERLDLPVPATRRLRPAEEPLPADLGLPYPVILKPITRRSDRWCRVEKSGKAVQVDSAAALRELWPKLVESGLEFLAQELVTGPESRIESYHCYVDDGGRVRGEFTGRKIRTYPVEYGHSTALEITAEADVAALGRDLVRRLDLRGVAKFDFKRTPAGELRLLEVNPRFNLWHHPGALAGVNLAAMVYDDLTGRAATASTDARAGVQWGWLWEDALAARASGVPLGQWLPWALSCQAKSVLAVDDPMPFVRGVLWKQVAKKLPVAAKG